MMAASSRRIKVFLNGISTQDRRIDETRQDAKLRCTEKNRMVP